MAKTRKSTGKAAKPAAKAAAAQNAAEKQPKIPDWRESYRGETVSLKASVFEVIDDGKESGTWRAMLRATSGHLIQVVHDKALPAQPGDDLYLTGRYYLSGAKNVPDEFRLSPDQPADRLDAMRKSGARVRGFGTGNIPADQRPAAKVWKAARARGLTVIHAHPAATVVQAAETSTDPAIQWGAELFRGMHKRHAVVMFNPLAFPPSPKKHKPGSKAAAQADKAFAAELRQALPAGLQSIASDQWLLNQKGFPGRSTTWGLGQPAAAHSLLNVVNPFTPNRSTAATMQGYASLPQDDFAPKRLLDPMTRKCFTVAHELAHSVQMYYGITRPGASPTHDSHRAECFADTFATFAILQHLGDEDGLKMIRDMRYSALLTITPTHVTGRAMEEALKRAIKLKKAGVLGAMTPQDMAKQAAEITRDFAFTPNEINRIMSVRDEFYRDNFVRIEKLNAQRNSMLLLKYDKVEAFKLMGRAVRDPDQPMAELTPYFAESLKAIKRIAYTPDQLAKATNRRAAMKLYEQDLTKTLALDANDRWFALDVIEGETALMVSQPTTKRKAYVQRSRQVQLAEQREKVIARFAKKHGLTHNKGRPATNTHTPATIIRPAQDATGKLSRWFALPADKRFEAYKQAVAREHAAFETWQKHPQSVQQRNIFQHMRIQRGQIAYAIRGDREVWAARRDYADSKLVRDISQAATRHISVMTADKPIELHRTRLRRSLKRSGLKSPRAEAAKTAKKQPQAPKPG